MKRFRRLLVGLVLVLGVAFLAALPAGVFTGSPANCKCGGTAALANLQTALQGASTFYADNGSYSGIYGGRDISTITGIDVGLTFVSGQPSTASNVISLATKPRGGWLVLAAYATSPHDCFIVVDLRAEQTRPIAGESDKAPGVYYGVIRSTNTATCNASASMAGTDYSTSGWPRA
jgi:hypothetical protein